MPPLTLADLGNHLNMPELPPEDDPRRGELQRALDTATQELTRMTGRLDGTQDTVEVESGDGLLRLPRVALASVDAVRDPSGLLVAGMRVNLLAGLVWVPAPAAGAWQVTCTGKPWPSALQSAALDWAAHVYDTQRQSLNATTEDTDPLPTYALPRRVGEFARPYLLPGIA